MIKIIHIIKDEEGIHCSNYTYIKVKDLKSYLESRNFYEHNKFLTNIYEIIVQNKKYFDYYLDIETEDLNVKTKNLSNLEYIYDEFPKKILTKNSLEFIKKYKILDNKEQFLLFYKENYSFDENLMFFLLDIYPENRRNFYSLIEKLNNAKTLISFDLNLYSILKKVFFQNLKTKEELEIIELIFKDYKQEDWKHLIFQSLVLSSYPLNDYEILNSDSRLNSYYMYFSIQKKSISFEYLDFLSNIEKIDILIRNNYEKLEVYNKNFDLMNYLSNITGLLNFELEFLVENYIKKLDRDVNIDLKKDFLMIREIFIEKLDLFREKIEVFEDFSYKYIKLLNIEKDYDTLDNWKAFFVKEYIGFNNTLKKESIYDSLKKVEALFKIELKYIQLNIEKIINMVQKNFSNYILNNYDRLVSSENKMGLDYCLESINNYIEPRSKTILFFIDCLRYDIYNELKSYLFKKGYIPRIEDDIKIASLPTVTNYCKNTLFSGIKYNTLITRGTQIEESMIKNALYINDLDKIEDSIEISKSKSDYIFYKTTDIDYFIHNIKDLDMEFIKSQIMKKINSFIENMQTKETYNIVIMTDHGSVYTNRMIIKSLNNDTKNFLQIKNLKLDSHGRYLKIFGNFYNEGLYEELGKHLIEDYTESFHILKRENLSEFYLPKNEKNQENYFYLIAKENYTPSFSKGEYSHGGLSLEEVFVPFQIFSKIENQDDKGVEIKPHNSNSIFSKKECFYKIEVFNKNKFSINNIRIRLRYKERETIVEEIKPNESMMVEIPLFYEEIGNVKDVLEVKYNFSGNESNYNQGIDIKVEENRKEILNKKLKSSRTLL